jgi:enoyl-CoA hydratase
MIKLAKLSLTGIEDGDLEKKYLSEQQYTLKAYASSDSAETRRAFLERRDADFGKTSK